MQIGAVITFSFPVSQALLFAILQACTGLYQHLTYAPANKPEYYVISIYLLIYMRYLRVSVVITGMTLLQTWRRPACADPAGSS